MRAHPRVQIVTLILGAAVSCSSTKQADDASLSVAARDAGSSGDDATGQEEGTCDFPVDDPIPAGGACPDLVTHCAAGTDSCLFTALRATLVPAFAACKIRCGEMRVGFSAGCATVLASGGMDPAAADCLRNIVFNARYDCVPRDGWQRLYVESCTLP